jgi:hypothetical protein
MIRALRVVATVAFPLALVALTGCPKPSSESSGGGGSAGSSTAATTTSATASGSAAGSAAPTSAASTIKFTKLDPQVGATWSESESVDMSFDVTKPDKVTFEQSNKNSKKVEILATSGKAITKIKVTYNTASEKTKANGEDKTKTAQVTGNTYIVESSGGGINVTDENHKPVGASETAFVAADFGSLGKPDPFLSQLPDIPLSVGSKVDSLADALRESVAATGELHQSSVTLQSITPDGNGVFDVKLSYTQAFGKLKMTFNIDGTITVRASDSRIVSSNLKGPITFGEPGVAGKGTFSNTDNFTY